MFDLDPGKLLVIGIVALIAIPSKDLPRVLRTLGQVTGRMRRMANEFQDQFMAAMREAELDDLKKQIEETNSAIMAGTNLNGAFDPLAEARKQIVSAIEDGDKKSPQEHLPHSEEPQSGVSTEGQPATDASPLETPSTAPQDEVGGNVEAGAAQKADK
ncbi:preprotein translocase subunit TatA [Methylocystis sp. MJC1]|jgi:sec-independent protein translocase protein TatB|uniref:preprotein translocase subunit TatA n=1 Tax=Methylocystis sp. MJC1 TaxID=2654282 RepID=UPI0013ED46EB|nr:preprotein translocase subunit TatA [Methylocystis sp. MJC1]KAF2992836.1 Sec-independent protein translocase protein TatB [Methylocystis sp. MJC1]MBU6526795.1 preprotein translocase subunit TatA [Methylocystis sp. MJC1]UZX13229.1 preprotein translocase subunit TatA [Methylocystis sp. MJC1]